MEGSSRSVRFFCAGIGAEREDVAHLFLSSISSTSCAHMVDPTQPTRGRHTAQPTRQLVRRE